MSVAIKSNPVLWDRIVKSVKKSNVGGLSNTWNARKAQLAVKKYKSLGGRLDKNLLYQSLIVKSNFLKINLLCTCLKVLSDR